MVPRGLKVTRKEEEQEENHTLEVNNPTRVQATMSNIYILNKE
jgi:hypothetical protein